MKKDLQYALVTSSALPEEIAESEQYVELEKTQWLDLIDYSEQLVKTDEDQEILFLIVAKGTQDQIEKDQARREAKEADKKRLLANNQSLGSELENLQEDREGLMGEIKHLNAQISILEKELDERVDIQAKHDLLQEQLNEIMGTKSALKEELEQMKEEDELAAQRAQQEAEAESIRKKALRERSVNLFNALYQK
tara:strand:+ start:1208 stop:1792 length:585 start_codon:yes stop_codon:yes gene_type:complete